MIFFQISVIEKVFLIIEVKKMHFYLRRKNRNFRLVIALDRFGVSEMGLYHHVEFSSAPDPKWWLIVERPATNYANHFVRMRDEDEKKVCERSFSRVLIFLPHSINLLFKKNLHCFYLSLLLHGLTPLIKYFGLNRQLQPLKKKGAHHFDFLLV